MRTTHNIADGISLAAGTQTVNATIEQRLAVVLPILQGLLASGHYTEENDDQYESKVLRHDAGDEWEAYSTRRQRSMAIEDAIHLAKELRAELEMDLRDEQEESM